MFKELRARREDLDPTDIQAQQDQSELEPRSSPSRLSPLCSVAPFYGEKWSCTRSCFSRLYRRWQGRDNVQTVELSCKCFHRDSVTILSQRADSLDRNMSQCRWQGTSKIGHTCRGVCYSGTNHPACMEFLESHHWTTKPGKIAHFLQDMEQSAWQLESYRMATKAGIDQALLNIVNDVHLFIQREGVRQTGST